MSKLSKPTKSSNSPQISSDFSLLLSKSTILTRTSVVIPSKLLIFYMCESMTYLKWLNLLPSIESISISNFGCSTGSIIIFSSLLSWTISLVSSDSSAAALTGSSSASLLDDSVDRLSAFVSLFFHPRTNKSSKVLSSQLKPYFSRKSFWIGVDSISFDFTWMF